MRPPKNFLFLFFMNSISRTCPAEINVIDADVDVGTNDTTLVLLMDSDVRLSIYSFVQLYIFNDLSLMFRNSALLK